MVRLPAEDPALSDTFLPKSGGLDHAGRASTCFMVLSGGVLAERFRHGGPGVCLGVGQTEAERVPWRGGRGDALLCPHTCVKIMLLVWSVAMYGSESWTVKEDDERWLWLIPTFAGVEGHCGGS